MAMLGFFKKKISTRKRGSAPDVAAWRKNDRRQSRQSFDAAETTDSNSRHWVKADNLSADAAASPERRLTLRNRARYEVANNSFAKGIEQTLANDTVGNGPILQLTGRNNDNGGDFGRIETEFVRWARAVKLAEKLRTMRMSRLKDGEAFALLVNNPYLSGVVKLDVRLVEAEQIATPFVAWLKPNQVDGIEFDAFDNPIFYHLLKYHPGDNSVPFTEQPQRIPAEYVIHDFRPDRPGQHRGLPELMPALPLFAYLRRYVLAVVEAAEVAANVAMAVQSKQPAPEDAEAPTPYDTVEFERGMAMVLPDGYELGGFKPEQPATTHVDFVRAVLTEIARCLNMPYCVAAGDSSNYNYASGRLDHQTYLKAIEVDRGRIESTILDRVFDHWLREYLSARSGISPANIDTSEYAHQWFWTGREHVDPVKVSQANQIDLTNNMTTLATIYAAKGRDWEVELLQRAKEVSLIKQLGLSVSAVQPSGTEAGEEENEEEENENETIKRK